MENYFYKCPACGFVHLVPAYWNSYSPDKELELKHFNVETGDPCDHKLLLDENS